jgi:hypothetical protein
MSDESQGLVDRQKIWECLLRYTRGVDRLDRALTLAAFHPDAMIDQGAFRGGREAFADWVLGHHRDHQAVTQHTMTNFLCEIDGEFAHSETYVSYYGVNLTGKDSFAVGRYVDRLERRAGQWRIVDRVCVTEGATDFDKNAVVARFSPGPQSIARSTRNTSDPSYARPLAIQRD